MSDIRDEIQKYMDFEEFIRIQGRLKFLRGEEEAKLRALAELQQAFLAANTDLEREKVSYAVANIRELSRKTREEIRSLNSEIIKHMSLELAKSLCEKFSAEARSSQRLK